MIEIKSARALGSVKNKDMIKEYDWACLEPQDSDCDSCVAKQYCHYFD